MDIKPYLHYAAKAVAAFLAPWIVVLVSWLARQADVDILLDPAQVETYISSAIVSIGAAAWVYFQRNGPKPD